MATSNIGPVASTLERMSLTGSALNVATSEQDIPSAVRERSRERQSTSAAVANDGGSTVLAGSQASDIEQQSYRININQTTTLGDGVWRYVRSVFSPNNNHHESSEDEDKAKAEKEYEKYKSNDINEYPPGMPKIAKFQSSDDDVSIFRGFKHLRTRALLDLQAELTKMEEDLLAQDRQIAEEESSEGLDCRVHDSDSKSRRQDLLGKIFDKLTRYDEMLIHFAKIRTLDHARKNHHRFLFYWVRDQPLDEASKKFLYHRDDFVSVAGTNSDFFERLVQKYFQKYPKSCLMKYFVSEEDVQKNTDPNFGYFSKSRVTAFAKILLVSLTVGILLTPVFLLFLVPMTRGLMALILSTFLLLFSATMTFTSKAKTQEIFVGAATYGAFLIVFLGNLTKVVT